MDCFQVWANMNRAAINICVQDTKISRSGIRSYHKVCITSNLLQNCQTLSRVAVTIVHSQQQCKDSCQQYSIVLDSLMAYDVLICHLLVRGLLVSLLCFN